MRCLPAFLLFAVVLQDKPGALVVVGGGGMPAEIVKKTIELAGGAEAAVVVVPQASEAADAGKGAVEMWKRAGAREVSLLDLAEPGSLRKATLIWIDGGQQSRLMKLLEGTPVPDLIRERHRQGAVVGGTSAGAAVQSKVMIAGDNLPVGEGLGLAPDVVFDQHFVARRRFNRLLQLILERPQLVGIGIDEGTAVIARGNTYEVIGQGQVQVIDARKAQKGRNVALHVLTSGMTFELK